MTTLFHDIIFGPVRSRRLGLSLGVNLLPTEYKLCNFDCIYCECGWGEKGGRPRFNRREDVRRLLGEKLREMIAGGAPPDVITFAGNGEPTIHPEFPAIIDDVIALRNEISPASKISVLTNATMIGQPEIREALQRVEMNIAKLDSAFDETMRLMNNAQGNCSVAETVRNMKLFNGQIIIQTMFLRGEYQGQHIDNTAPREVDAWLKLVREIAPQQVMIYTLDRDTPCKTLEKIPLDELRRIAARVETLGIPCSAAG